MALETGGIDQQVEQRMDTFRGSPEKLQQRSKVSGSLLDLLALQKLTSEKKAAAADMQLKMQQDPNTIKQKLEQEALSLVKQGMGSKIKNVAGSLNQKQAMQQKNLQRVAKGNQPPAGISGLPGLGGKPLNRNPQAAGLANARMAQVAGQGGPRRMAQGGVVGFQSGEDVNLGTTPFGRTVQKYIPGYPFTTIPSRKPLPPETELKQRVAAKFRTIGNEIFEPISPAQYEFAQNVIKNINSYTPAELEKLERVDVSQLTDTTAFDSFALQDSPAAEGKYPMATPEVQTQPQSPFPTSFDDRMVSEKFAREADAPIQTEAFKMPSTLETPTVNTPAVETGPSGGITEALDVFDNRGVLKRGGAGGTDGGTGGGLESIMMDSAAVADKITGREDKAARFAEMKQEALDKEAELFDPAMERSNRLTDFLVGGAGTTTLGGLAKGAVGASRATQEKQNAAAIKRMADRFATEVTGMQVDAGLAGASLSLGTAVFNQAEQSKRTAQQIAANKSTAKLRAETEKIKLKHDALSEAQKIKIQERLAAVAEQGAVTDAARLELNRQKEKARVSELDAKTNRETQLAADKAILKEWTEYTSFIMELSSEFLDDAREDIQNQITLLSDKTAVGDEDQQTKTNAQIAELNKQLNSTTYLSGLATLKANQFISAVLGGEAFLDRYDSLVPMVQTGLNRARQAQGITEQTGLNVANRTYRE